MAVREVHLVVEWPTRLGGDFESMDHLSTRELRFWVVGTMADEAQVPRWTANQELHCEACGEPVGSRNVSVFVPYTVDVATTVLCNHHSKESVLEAIWPTKFEVPDRVTLEHRGDTLKR